MMDAGIYARISLDQKDDEGEKKGLGVQRQVQDCKAKAKALGWNVVEVYEDNDMSATKATPRPAYQRLMADLAGGKLRAVVVYDLDRLTRRPRELEDFIDLAEKHGVSLANVSGDVDLSNENGRMVARIKGAVARQEAERIGRRVRRQKQQRAEQGLPQGGRQRLYGYDREWNLIDHEAAIVKEAFTRRASGESTTAIAKDFASRGLLTVAGKPWAYNNLSKTLSKPMYAGLREYNGTIIGSSNVPAIIDEETFNACQKNLRADSAGTNTRRYLLSGILKCKHCLSPMKGNPSKQMYRCSTTYGGCGRLSVKIHKADLWIAIAAQNKALETPQKKAKGRDYDAELEALQEGLQRLQEGFSGGVYTLQEVTPMIKEQRAKILEANKAKVQDRPRFKTYATEAAFAYRDMNLSQKRAFISTYIDGVVVGPAVSRGHQPFDPARFEVHYADGRIETLSGAMDPEDV